MIVLTLLALLVASQATAGEVRAQPEDQASTEQVGDLDAVELTDFAVPPPAELLAPIQGPPEPEEQPASDAGGPVPPPAAVSGYPVVFNEWVEHFLDFFQTPGRRAITSIWLNRSGRYLDMIRSVLQSHGLPVELAYVAMIESGFNPVAVSRAGAKGLWQFMEHTARRYGLRVDRWVDERLDPEKSTVAAAMYLRDLFGQFGSWLLAKAAYNAGELKVARALEHGRTDDFWVLTRGRVLREETKRFVPAILAAMLIGQDPERYGFEVSPEPPLAYDVVTVPPLVELKRLGPSAGIPPEELMRLNPELRRGITPPESPYSLKVPSGTASLVGLALTEIRPGRGTVHVVRPRDTLSGIAKRYGVSVSDLARWNRLSDPSRIFPGERLVISESR